MSRTRLWLFVTSSCVAVACMTAACFIPELRMLIADHLASRPSIASRMAEIRARQPDLAGITPRHVELWAFKHERRLEVWCDGHLWETFPFTASSGTLGPKTRQGDLQIPEGIYRIDAVNPNSSFHLSLRVSYPNATDLARAHALGVSDPGGDIYIHGMAASVGCIAIGNHAIERVFYVVNTVVAANVRIVIAPVDFRTNTTIRLPDEPKLYHDLRTLVCTRQSSP